MIKGGRAFHKTHKARIEELRVPSGFENRDSPLTYVKVLTRELSATAEGDDVASSRVADIMTGAGLLCTRRSMQ